MALGLLAGYLSFAIPTISVIRDPCFFLKSFQRDADQAPRTQTGFLPPITGKTLEL
jgi:hypothetical protein